MKTLHVVGLTVLSAIVAGLCAAALGQAQSDAPPAAQQQAQQAQAPASQPAAKEIEALHLTTEEYPRVDGSTSANPLGVLAACTLTDRDYLWVLDSKENKRLVPTPRHRGRYWRRVGSAALSPANNVPPLHALKDDYLDKTLLQKTDHTGTDTGYVNLIKGKVDCALMCRKASNDEEKLAKSAGVQLYFQPVALDAFVFLLNKDNPVAGLTVEQIRSIYAKEITLWEQVGGPGPNHAIHAYIREKNSGSQVTLEKLLMRGKAFPAGENMMAESMIGPYNLLPTDKYGIGFTFYYYDKFMASLPGTKLAAVNGVLPSSETIASNKYPLVTKVFLVYRQGLDPNSNAGKLASWFLSDAGQRTVARSGYVPIRKVEPEPTGGR